MSKLGKVSGEVRANGKEKSFFFSGFGKKKKAEKIPRVRISQDEANPVTLQLLGVIQD